MPRKYTRRNKDGAGEGESKAPLPGSMEALERDIASLMATLPDDDEIELYRETPEGKWAALAVVPAGAFSINWVVRNCGGGKYNIIARYKTGDKVGQIFARKFFEIDTSIPRRAPVQPGDRAASGSGFGESIEGMPPMMMFILQQQQAAADRQMEMMARMSEQTTSILTAMIARPNDQSAMVTAIASLMPRAERTDPVAMARDLMELTKGTKPAEPVSLLDRIEEIQTIGRMLSGQSPDDDNPWRGLIRDFLPQTLQVLGTAAEAFKNRNNPNPPPTPALPPGPDPLAAILPPLIAARIRELVPEFVARGLADGDPEAFAVTVVEKIPLGLYSQVHDALKEDGLPAAIVEAVPELQQIPTYFAEFIASMVELTAPAEEAEDLEVDLAGPALVTNPPPGNRRGSSRKGARR